MTRLLKKMKNEISFGRSPLGFLYAGEIENPSCIAYHVTMQTIPEEFDLYLVKYFLPKIKTFVDIGANTGLYCFVAANENKTAKIYAFEPQKDCIKYLNKTISLNNWENRFEVKNIGLGNKKEDKLLNLSQSGSSFNKDFNDFANLPTELVKVDTLDNQIKSEKIDFIKIDVEGFEQAVLEGAINTIRNSKPVLFVEIADKVKGRKYRNPDYIKTINWLQNENYQIYRCENYSIKKINKPNPQKHLAMYLCLHKEKHKMEILEIVEWSKKYKWIKLNNYLKYAGSLLKNPRQILIDSYCFLIKLKKLIKK